MQNGEQRTIRFRFSGWACPPLPVRMQKDECGMQNNECRMHARRAAADTAKQCVRPPIVMLSDILRTLGHVMNAVEV